MAEASEDSESLLVEPPRCFLLHLFDDDVFGFQGASALSFAALLEPCRVVALGLDEAALRCTSLDEVAELMRQRILADVRESPCSSWRATAADVQLEKYAERVVISGYGFGALVAQRVAASLRSSPELEVALVLLDSEVTWPPSYSLDRMGGYRWLGGRVEAALLMCRGCGHSDAARALTQEALAALEQGGLDEDDLLMRAFWLLAAGGMTHKYFNDCIAHLELCLDVAHEWGCAADAAPQAFDGEALLLRSASREFAVAEAAVAPFCPRLEVAQCRGTHYTMLQQEHVQSVMKPLSDFLISRGFLGTVARDRAQAGGRPLRQLPVQGLRVVSEGDHRDAPTVYIAHALKPYVTEEWLGRVAELLAPCRVAALEFDEQAAQSGSPQSLAAVYQDRIQLDLRQRAG